MRMDLGKSGVRVMGTWSSSTAYEKNDIVTNGSDGYISITDVPVGTALSNTAYWMQIVNGFDESEVVSAVNAWLVAHPEATTTVQDGAVTTAKIADGAVTDAKLVQSGGVLEEVADLKSDLDVRRPTWEQGVLAFANGELTASTTRICSSVLNDKINTISVPSEYDLGLLAWDGSTYMGAWNVKRWTKGTVWAKSFDLSVIRLTYPNYTFRLNLRYANNSNITTNSANVVTIYPSSIIDDFSNNFEVLDMKMESALTGEETLDTYSPFVNAGLINGAIYDAMKYRIASTDIMTFDRDITLRVADGYRFGVHTFVNGVFSANSGWKQTDYTIPKDTEFRIVIAHVAPEDTESIADIQEFVSKVTFNTVLADKIGSDTNESGREQYYLRDGNFFMVAHQGYPTGDRSLGYNLLDGYPLARKKGFEWAECDIEIASGNVPVCCHDPSFVDATTGNTIVIADHTVEELKTYDYYGSTIATFEEIIKCCKENGLQLQLDHITSPKMPYITPIVKQYGMERSVCYLVGYVDDSPYPTTLLNAIQTFDESAYIMLMANETTISGAINFANTIITPYNRVDITVNSTKFTPTDLKTHLLSMKAGVNFSTYVIDNVATAREYLPYVNSITSNTISSFDVFDY